MKLIMVQSADGYVARGPQDDMKWTGSWDKKVFRLLTSVGGPLAAGSKTYDQLPELKGREIFRLSNKGSTLGRPGISLGHFHRHYKEGWLIGGQEVAVAALDRGMVDEAFIMHVDVQLIEGISAGPLNNLIGRKMLPYDQFQFGDCRVRKYKRNGCFSG